MEVNNSTNTTTTAGAVASFCDPTQMPMTMLMMGFATSWDPAWGCLVFLFQNFNINSVGSLILTYVITLALALFEHGVDFGRKILRQRNDAGNICFTIIDSTLYALKLGAAYLLMLVAMTYRTDLFIVVLLSLGVAHVIFHGQICCKICCKSTQAEEAAAAEANPYAVALLDDDSKAEVGTDGDGGCDCCGTD